MKNSGANGVKTERLPQWLKVRPVSSETFQRVHGLVRIHRLNTVCVSAACPNRSECWNAGTATFMILGDVCTRSCGFCNVRKGIPHIIDRDEPERVGDAVARMGLAYAVITSVTRDDLDDGGAGIFAETISAVRRKSQGCRIEVLIPDFQGTEISLRKVLLAGPDILNHNIETVSSLYSRVRPGADYRRSLEILRRAKMHGITTKSGLMLGLGECPEEVRAALRDLREAGCDILTVGQYLRPNRSALPVERYYEPDEFLRLRDEGISLGFRQVLAGPLVRSSYQAAKSMEEMLHQGSIISH